ncbi:hypothetical protein HYZ64_03915 [Candidatus Berkelbacteria bacterium]|nr:hypothetical protein [Candidatus Berkelbacteria bacterium]
MFSNFTIYLQRIGVAFGMSLALVGAVAAQTTTTTTVDQSAVPPTDVIDYDQIDPRTIPGQGLGRFVEGYWRFRSRSGSPEAKEGSLASYKAYVVGACKNLAESDSDKAKQILDARIGTIDDQRALNAQNDQALAAAFEGRSKAEMARLAALAGGDRASVFSNAVNSAFKANSNIAGFLGKPLDLPPEALGFLSEDQRAVIKGLPADLAFERIASFMSEKGLPPEQMFAAMAGAAAAGLPPGFIPSGKIGDIQKFTGLNFLYGTNQFVGSGGSFDDPNIQNYFKNFGTRHVGDFDPNAHDLFQNFNPSNFTQNFSNYAGSGNNEFSRNLPHVDFERAQRYNDEYTKALEKAGGDPSKIGQEFYDGFEKKYGYQKLHECSGPGCSTGQYPAPGDYKGGQYPQPKPGDQYPRPVEGGQPNYQSSQPPTEGHLDSSGHPYSSSEPQQYQAPTTSTTEPSTSTTSTGTSPTQTHTDTTSPTCPSGQHYDDHLKKCV